MTEQSMSYDAIRADVRERATGRADGDLMLVFVGDDGLPLLVLDVDEGTRHLDELFFRHVTALVLDIRLPAVVLAVLRATGRPTRMDRRLWQEMTSRLDGATTELLDLLVLGDAGCWSVAARRAVSSSLPGAA